MNHQEQILWQKISAFEFDAKDTVFTFAKRVARENGWSPHYTKRVIKEYKRFIFLCCICNKGITPSDPVDQVWHLHLTYTQSYWMDFCEKTLAKQIHHHPTMGGNNEAIKFDNYYSYTVELYEEKFNNIPPADIWQPNKERFNDINFERVNKNKYWIIRKPESAWKYSFAVLLLVLGGLISLNAPIVSQFTFIIMIAIVGCIGLIIKYRNPPNKNDNENGGAGCGSGCTSGCGNDSSVDSGCSSSGCSGCGSGCGS
jgi:hypothetical protein